MKLIDETAVVAEIKEIKSYIGSDKYLSDFEKGCNFGREDVCDSLLNFLDTLEVKEVDLDEEVNVCLFSLDIDREERPETAEVIEIVAKHFFELGIKQKDK